MVSPPSPTEMFPFGEFPSLNGMCRAVNPTREVPFGHPQIKGCMRLPGAYRRLPRPSSALKPSYPLDGVAAESPTLALTSTCVSLAYQTIHGVQREPHQRLTPAISSKPSRPRTSPIEEGILCTSLKFTYGGDPAAGSPTATLLRLLPPRRPQIRHHPKVMPHLKPTRLERRAVCARSRDVFTARC